MGTTVPFGRRTDHGSSDRTAPVRRAGVAVTATDPEREGLVGEVAAAEPAAPERG
jgi:hypothetical protein